MIQTGLAVLLQERRALLQHQRVGLVTHPAAVLPDLTNGVDVLLSAGVELAALFGPEHGYDGSASDGTAVANSTDPRTGRPVFSLYGPTKQPTPEMLAKVDVLVFDMQDVGARFYTFVSTLYYVLRGAAEAHKPVIVLDRPNPINGTRIEGGLIARGLESFIGIIPIPIRHGLTTAELASYMNTEGHIGADLTVVEMRGWKRTMWYDQTGLPWVPLSPGMPKLETATVYPGMCFVEGTNLSEGRGTALPFEVVGAPWLDGDALAQALNQRQWPGVRFRALYFVPSAGKHAGEKCSGVQVHVLDREAFRPVETGLHIIAACRAQAPDRFQFLPSSWEGHPPHFDLLTGDARVREEIANNAPLDSMIQSWRQAATEFERRRAGCLLYP
ncbi:MAG: DUF1343 domain-containing protein [Chloroflexi bacterium]|nr:DUF1343 domain-containing protein [Chloroflexota bacterium]MCL5952021.1 DUF1343 domain-containing protein [Chloroflexota bacterium]